MLTLNCFKAKIHHTATPLDEQPRVSLLEAPRTEPRVAQRAVPPAIAVPLALCSRDQSQRKGCAPAYCCRWIHRGIRQNLFCVKELRYSNEQATHWIFLLPGRKLSNLLSLQTACHGCWFPFFPLALKHPQPHTHDLCSVMVLWEELFLWLAAAGLHQDCGCNCRLSRETTNQYRASCSNTTTPPSGRLSLFHERWNLPLSSFFRTLLVEFSRP